MLPESNQILRERSRIIHILSRYHSINPCLWNIRFVLKLKIFRSKDPDWRFWTHTHCSLIYFETLSPLPPGEAQFISQIVKISHKAWNCVSITSILSFHYFVSFWAILLHHIWSCIRGLLECLTIIHKRTGWSNNLLHLENETMWNNTCEFFFI